jgi:Rad52/22 family double-strand break repair protein
MITLTTPTELTLSTKHAELFASLAAPFARGEVKSRTQAGRQMAYVTARTVMNRLDAVLGPENWEDDYTPLPSSVVCRLTITLPDGRKVTKVDAGGGAGMADEGDDDKSAFSDAFKRAAVKFGVARYLYGDGVATYAELVAAVAAPFVAEAPAIAASAPATVPMKPAPAATTLPEIKTARELYTFARANRLLPLLGEMGRANGLPARIVDWADGNARLIWEAYVEGLPAFGRNGTDG